MTNASEIFVYIIGGAFSISGFCFICNVILPFICRCFGRDYNMYIDSDLHMRINSNNEEILLNRNYFFHYPRLEFREETVDVQLSNEYI